MAHKHFNNLTAHPVRNSSSRVQRLIANKLDHQHFLSSIPSREQQTTYPHHHRIFVVVRSRLALKISLSIICIHSLHFRDCPNNVCLSGLYTTRYGDIMSLWEKLFRARKLVKKTTQAMPVNLSRCSSPIMRLDGKQRMVFSMECAWERFTPSIFFLKGGLMDGCWGRLGPFIVPD